VCATIAQTSVFFVLQLTIAPAECSSD